jgi:hypothetical protein
MGRSDGAAPDTYGSAVADNRGSIDDVTAHHIPAGNDDPSRRRLIIGGVASVAVAALAIRSLTARQPGPSSAALDPLGPDALPTTVLVPIEAPPPSTTSVTQATVWDESTSLITDPVPRNVSSGSVVGGSELPEGQVVGWYGDKILTHRLFSSDSELVGVIQPVGRPFLMSVDIVGTPTATTGVVAFGTDGSGDSTRTGLWLLSDGQPQSLLVEGASFISTGTRGGPLYVQLSNGLVQPVVVGRAPLLASFRAEGNLRGSTAAGVVLDNQGEIAWMAWPGGESATVNVIGVGTVLDTGANVVLWHSGANELRVTDVNTGSQWEAVTSAAPRLAVLNGDVSVAAAVSDETLIVWDSLGNVKRFGQRNVVQLLWLSTRHLLVAHDDLRARVLDLAIPHAPDVLEDDTIALPQARLPFLPSALAWRPGPARAR